MSDKSSMDLTPLADRLTKAEVYDEFCALMFDEEMHYHELLLELDKWNVSSSKGALSRFKASQRGKWAMERAKREEKEFLATHGAELDEATRKLIAMRIFQDAAAPNTSTKDVLRMAELEVQKAKLQQDAIKLKQAQTKLEQAQELIDLQKRKIETLEAAEARVLAEKRAAEEAMLKASKDGGMTEETMKGIRKALGMPDETPAAA